VTKTQDRVERGAELMAHPGEKDALGVVGCFLSLTSGVVGHLELPGPRRHQPKCIATSTNKALGDGGSQDGGKESPSVCS
jgi:hypothetical protein